jgi:hypothetical protein
MGRKQGGHCGEKKAAKSAEAGYASFSLQQPKINPYYG